jgi:hypothetical protein
MQTPLHDHLIFLHDSLQQLTAQVTQSDNEVERAEIDGQIEFVRQTIEHYRRAYEMESAFRGARSAHLASMDQNPRQI